MDLPCGDVAVVADEEEAAPVPNTEVWRPSLTFEAGGPSLLATGVPRGRYLSLEVFRPLCSDGVRPPLRSRGVLSSGEGLRLQHDGATESGAAHLLRDGRYV